MGQKTITGLTLKDGIWHIDKLVRGYGRIRGSTGTSVRAEAEQVLLERIVQAGAERKERAHWRPTFRTAATRYLKEYAQQPSIWLTATYLKQLDPYIGDLHLDEVDNEALQAYVDDRLEAGRAPRTVNIALQRVVRVLNVASRKWRDDNRKPWLAVVPMIEMLSEKSRRQPYPLSWEEQAALFKELPEHLQIMALYKVNTGCREQEVCKLKWQWEIEVEGLGTSVFLIPAEFGGRFDDSGVKNREERLVVLNEVARSIIRKQRGQHPEWVFPYEGRALHRMNDTAWRNARKRAAAQWKKTHGTAPHPGFASLRVHDLKHTYGRRLRAADVPEEDRKALLGHTDGSITSHYSTAELAKLIEYANRVSATDTRSPALTVLKRKVA
ncbi:tyrosine-type recombinase/integrase [Achromobacter sp.]|uniref:tyrosine-type recombinase/integrase n=1 Tax=Achromobacter sp. TaxID=134375 RepID=UPI0028A5A76B|nr:tyrosine-type recombinase/integrase [Achromobacter sp.]